MVQKKVCLLGAFGVGKTSLVHRYVQGIFSEVYQTTIGVRIDKKVVPAAGGDVLVVVWDIYGQDEFQAVVAPYLRGAAGFLLVADGTRGYTLDVALDLHKLAAENSPGAPSLLLLNKLDLIADWEIDERRVAELASKGWAMVRTSAKTGEGVEDAFHGLVQSMVSPQ
jgi:small GTP-binding protein